MAEMIKLIGSEIALSTANTVGKATVVRTFNNTGGAVLITIANTGGTIGTCTLAAGALEYYQKQPNDTISSNAAIRTASVGIN